MKHVVVLFDTRDYRAMSKILVSIPSDRRGYLVCGEDVSPLAALLQGDGYRLIDTQAPDQRCRDQFLKEYIDLIGRLAPEQNKFSWWASDIASKNRFTSRIPVLLQQFLSIISELQHGPCERIIIIDPPWVILRSLRAWCQAHGVQLLAPRHFPHILELSQHKVRFFCSLLCGAARTYVRSIQARRLLREFLQQDQKGDKPWYIIKTFIYNHSFLKNGEYQDTFFGPLLEFLQKQGKRVLVYAVILGSYTSCLKQIRSAVRTPIIPLEALVSLRDLIVVVARRLSARIRIPRPLLFFGHDVTDIIKNELRRTTNGIQWYQLLHYWSTAKLCRQYPPEVFLFTYENNPWEKMCTLAVREAVPQARLLGYCHTVIPQASANLFISKYEREVVPLPDAILTIGQVPRNIMMRSGAYSVDMIREGCGLHFQLRQGKISYTRRAARNILVALEGIPKVYKLIDYVVREIGNNNSYHLRVRMHPVLPLSKIHHLLRTPLHTVSNLTLSRGSTLEEDLTWADVVIYWGSAVALEALARGIPLVHYEMGSWLRHDPLFECSWLTWAVSDSNSLSAALQEIDRIPDQKFAYYQTRAIDYVKHYITPVSDTALARFIK